MPSFFKDGNTWGLRNFGQQDPKAKTVTSGVDVGAAHEHADKKPATWARASWSAVIDTGVNYDHRELKSSIWRNPGEIPGQCGVDDDRSGIIDGVHGFNAVDNTGDPMDRESHGTPVAGIVAAEFLHSRSLLRWLFPVLRPGQRSWPSKPCPVRVLGTIDSVVRCIDYAVANGAHHQYKL